MNDNETAGLPAEPGHLEEKDLVKELIRLQDARIAIQDKALDIDNEQVKREADFHRQRIQFEDEADQRRVRLIGRTLFWGAILTTAPVALFLYMVFFGNEAQSDNALAIVETLGIGLAGFGIFHALARGIRSITRPRHRL